MPFPIYSKKMEPMLLAEKVCTFLQKLRIYSDYDLSLSERESAINSGLQRKFMAMRKLTIDAQEHSLGWISAVARASILFRVGNCVEKSCIALMWLILHWGEHPIELFSIPGQDHYFIVIGRIDNKESDPSRWHKDTVIFDALDLSFFKVDSEAYRSSRIHKLIMKSFASPYPLGVVSRYRQEKRVKSEDFIENNARNSDIEDDYWGPDSEEEEEKIVGLGKVL